jgi:hypothetical protein
MAMFINLFTTMTPVQKRFLLNTKEHPTKQEVRYILPSQDHYSPSLHRSAVADSENDRHRSPVVVAK